MEKILRAAVERGASDLHIKADDVFRARIDGRLVPLTRQALTAEQTRAIAHSLIPVEADRQRMDALTDYDCSYALPGLGRFRVNIMRQRGAFSIVMRAIPYNVPSLQQLRLPPAVARIADAERGMILVTGVTGSGKSSTMAAMVRQINEQYEKHIVTLENPIEFLHTDVRASVTQREIGVDTESFRSGLRAALRQDPDVILIGEMRDAGDGRHGDEGGRDGPPAGVDAAHAGRAEHDPAHDGDVPARGAGGRAAASRGVAARRGVAAAASARGRERARGGRRGDAGDARDP
jgi:twitching motility protein PilT